MTNIGIVGATGLVGKEFISLIEERKFNYDEIFLFASDSSAGSYMNIPQKGKKLVRRFNKELFKNIDIAFFSAGTDIDKICVPKSASMGTICIDNSSAFRMDPKVPLVVPEINFNSIRKNDRIIANPNCSTIQLVLVLKLLLETGAIEHVSVSTYQAVSGAGKTAVTRYNDEKKGIFSKTDRPYFGNVIQSIGKTEKNGYCDEEMKIINETRKILNTNTISITPTVMRVPVDNAHTESVSVTFKKKADMKSIIKKLSKNNIDVKLCSEVDAVSVSGKDFTYVSRLRMDILNDKMVNMIVTADNLRVGAALNGIKIAERIIYEK